jgi:hypothetical protein
MIDYFFELCLCHMVEFHIVLVRLQSVMLCWVCIDGGVGLWLRGIVSFILCEGLDTIGIVHD